MTERLRRYLAALRSILRLMPRTGAGLPLLLGTLYFIQGLLPVAFVLGTGVVLGRVPAAVAGGPDSAAWSALTRAFIASAGVFVLQQLLLPLLTSLGELLARRIDGLIYRQLMDASLGSPGVAVLEDEQAVADLRSAATELEFAVQSPGQACAGLLALLNRTVQLVGYVVVIGVVFNWLAGLGVAAAVLVFRYGQTRGLNRYAEAREQADGARRKAEYLRSVAAGPGGAKEIRVFGLAGWLIEQMREATLEFLGPVWAARRRILLKPFIGYTLWGLCATGFALILLGRHGAHGLALTRFAIAAQATLGALRLSEYYPEADLQIAIGMRAYEALNRFRAAAGAVPQRAVTATAAAERAERCPAPTEEIRFENVRFAYPGSDRPVFDGLDLTIPAGKCTALVGVNGSGKTTLVKLLARLYDPDEGAIRSDGADVRGYEHQDWRSRLAVIFQDFARYEVSAADNIGYGAIEQLEDRAGQRAAADAVGLTETLDRLPRGLQTPMARHLPGGADLSGGQWQRLALARALFALRHGARVLVLDEPTASMDVRAETRFYHQFARLAEGATTLLISHRFATVRHADHIVVLEHGRVIEQGDHASLLALDGRYATLFRLQADRMAGSGPDTGDAGDAGDLDVDDLDVDLDVDDEPDGSGPFSAPCTASTDSAHAAGRATAPEKTEVA